MRRALLLVTLVLMMLPGIASAQDCSTLTSDPVWVDGMKFVKSAVDAQAWDDALTQARQLYPKCPSSPILNYYIARCLQGQNDKIKSVQYFQTAADKTSEIATGPESSRLIWYARYEAEHPERTDKVIAENQARLEAAETKNVELKTALDKAINTKDAEVAKVRKEAALDAREAASLGMWTGTGIGIVGIGLVVAGGILGFMNDPEDRFEVLEHGEAYLKNGVYVTDQTYKASPKYSVGLGLLGAGAGCIVTGAIMAGIYGYRYSHIKIEDNELSFRITPQQFSLEMKF